MNTKQKRRLLNNYIQYIGENMHQDNILRSEYDHARAAYDERINLNQKLYFNGYKINRIETAFITESYQIISDAYIYRIDPLTGCKR